MENRGFLVLNFSVQLIFIGSLYIPLNSKQFINAYVVINLLFLKSNAFYFPLRVNLRKLWNFEESKMGFINQTSINPQRDKEISAFDLNYCKKKCV